MDNLLDGLQDIGSLAEIDSLNLRFNDYESIYFNSPVKENDKVPVKQEWYLMGVNYQKGQFEHRFDNPEILISLVNLARKIIEGFGLYDQKGQRDELAFYEDIKQWCQKYGLPYAENYFMTNYKKNGMGGYSAFRLWEFKRRIAMFYDRFQLWHGLTYDDTEKIIKYSGSSAFKILPGKLDSQLPDLKESIALEISAMANTSIGIKYNSDTNSFEIIPNAVDLISVAYFQLALLMTNNGTKGVNFCSVCHDLYEIHHRSSKICNNCKASYHRIKTRESWIRKNKKECAD